MYNCTNFLFLGMKLGGMGTKEKILVAALKLFNEEGIDVITIRHIAKEMDISHSNIQYYFKNADEIIATIFTDHINELDELPVFTDSDKTDLQAFKASVITVLEHIYQYRFIYIHFVTIARRMPEIREVYLQRYNMRNKQFLELFKAYERSGIVRKDIPDTVWKGLVQNIYIIGDFWISANEVTTQLKGKKAVSHYAALFMQIFYPYLTEKGKKLL